MNSDSPSPDKLPQEVREAIQRVLRDHQMEGEELTNGELLLDYIIGALAPLWPRPSPAASGEGDTTIRGSIETQCPKCQQKFIAGGDCRTAAAPKDSGEDTRIVDWLEDHAIVARRVESDEHVAHIELTVCAPIGMQELPGPFRAAVRVAMNPATGGQA